MKPRFLLARLCDLCHYSWKEARANRFPKILFIKKQTHWSNDKAIIELADQLLIIDLLATDKSRYFAQPRPIIVNSLESNSSDFYYTPIFWFRLNCANPCPQVLLY